MKTLLLFALLLGGVWCEEGRTEVTEKNPEDEERRMLRVLIDTYKEFIKTSGLTSDITSIIELSLDSADNLSQVDYHKPARELIKEIGDILVPIISFGLTFIPGVGPIISGVFSGVWKLVSPLFGGKAKASEKSQMEKMFEQMEHDMSMQMDERLRHLVSVAVHGEMSRNRYICNKFSLVSDEFTDELRSKRRIGEIAGVKLTLYLENCDNFLKDTAEAFVMYPEYADTLWIPAALSTFTRMAFLSEIVSYGHLLGLSSRMLVTYYQEIKNETQRQFQFHNQGLRERFENVSDSDKHDELTTPSLFETEACKLQGMLLYFDRELYPYGAPRVVTVTTAESITGGPTSPTSPTSRILNVREYLNETVQTNHVQVFYAYSTATTAADPKGTTTKKGGSKSSSGSSSIGDLNTYTGIYNCLMGPVVAGLPRSATLTVQLVLNKSYEIRILYVSREKDVTKKEMSATAATANAATTKNKSAPAAGADTKMVERIPYMSLIDEKPQPSVIAIKFSSNAATTKDTRNVFETDAAFFYSDCIKRTAAAASAEADCKWRAKYLTGYYRIDSVGTLNAESDPTTRASTKIEVDGNPVAAVKNEMDVLLVGIELIVRPIIVAGSATGKKT